MANYVRSAPERLKRERVAWNRSLPAALWASRRLGDRFTMDERAIFNNALEKTDPRERAAYLAGACGGDEALHRRVEALWNPTTTLATSWNALLSVSRPRRSGRL